MARTRDEQGQRILQAASELLSEEGASALSVRRIAAAAGCSTMGLYSRFGGKDGVVDELYAEGFEHLVDAMKANPTTDDPLADLRQGANCYRDHATANATHYMVMFGGAVPGFVPSDASHDLAHAAFDGLVAKVARCTDAGLLRGAPDQIAELLWGGMHGLVMLELVGINPAMSDPAARFDRMLDVLFRGLAGGVSQVAVSRVGISRVPDPVTARVRALVDGALDRVFDEPFDVRSAQELEDLVAAGPVGGGAGPSTTTITAFVAAATPMARRALSLATKSGKVASKAPLPSSKAFKIGMASIPVALRLSTVSRRGVRELQLLASYLVTQLRASGVDPDPGLVRSLTLSLYLDPARRPTLDIPGGRAAGAIARQWVLRSLGGDAESAVRARARRQAEAIDRLDLVGLGVEWARRRRHPPELTA